MKKYTVQATLKYCGYIIVEAEDSVDAADIVRGMDDNEIISEISNKSDLDIHQVEEVEFN